MYKETTLLQFISSRETEKKEDINNDADSKAGCTVGVAFGASYAPENTGACLLLSVDYDGERNCAYVRLYDPESGKLFWWYDNTGHRPYCLSDLSTEELKKNPRLMSHNGLVGFEIVEKYDLLHDRKIKMTKIIGSNPLAIGGTSSSIREIVANTWEDKIPYHHCYTYDRRLTPGMFWRIKEGNLEPVPLHFKEEKEIMDLFRDEPEEFQEILTDFLPSFMAPVPDIRRVAVDIEVSSVIDRIPDPETAENEVICAALVSNDGKSIVLILKREDMDEGEMPSELVGKFNVEYFTNECDLLRKIFAEINKYPVVLTFNGDNFDLNYLYHRALKLGFSKDEIPITLTKDAAYLHYGVHVDLYKFFHNRSIQVYAFSNKYKEETLDAISKSLINIGKMEVEEDLSQLPLLKLAAYCWQDAYITLELTRFDDNLVMKLIILLMRISRLSMEDLVRQGVSSWIKSLFYYEHRAKGYLISRPEDIASMKNVSDTKPITKDKKFKGAKVVKPKPGVHFNVAVLDFASLYPSIIKEYNLSYETVRCPHEECRVNVVPETTHWVCTKRRGMSSLIIGFLRDIRVKWFKPKSKDKSLSEGLRKWYSVVERALKVFINASYGVFGAEHFPFYCLPVAESTAAIGRYTIETTISKAQELSLEIIYGDTDSVFIKNPQKEKIEELIRWAQKTLSVDLDIDKVYRYVAFSERKKNYLGVFEDGSVDIKGLTGRKRNSPQFIQEAFLKMVEALSKVRSEKDFNEAKTMIEDIARTCYFKIQRKEYSLEEFAFRVQLTKSLKSYVKTTPQHVKAARQLSLFGKEIKPGDIISFVKVKGKEGVKPVELAKKEEIDTEKYKEYLRSTFEQVLDALGLEFDKIVGLTRLESWI
ncbi:MAG: DNA-directed DNA polymerase I [Candidatus Jordarchaeales archaeon]|nr:DNA-directed DNA polymerase I [Candidatus Jordarchaeia archaeon]